jgi:uncharacterized membrane protein
MKMKRRTRRGIPSEKASVEALKGEAEAGREWKRWIWMITTRTIVRHVEMEAICSAATIVILLSILHVHNPLYSQIPPSQTLNHGIADAVITL